MPAQGPEVLRDFDAAYPRSIWFKERSNWTNTRLRATKIDITSSSSVLIPVVQSLANVAAGLGTLVEGVSGVVVQKLLAAMGTDVGGALSSLVTSTPS